MLGSKMSSWDKNRGGEDEEEDEEGGEMDGEGNMEDFSSEGEMEADDSRIPVSFFVWKGLRVDCQCVEWSVGVRVG